MTLTSSVLSSRGVAQAVEVEQAVGLDGQQGEAEAFLLEAGEGVEHGLVLGDDGDEVVALALGGAGGALEGEVVGLGGAAGKDDFAGGWRR